MKIILLPTDFSEPSLNAIHYAIEIAKLKNSKLILFNVFSIPMIPAEEPIIIPIEEIEKNTIRALEKVKKTIQSENGNKLVIECKCACGFPVEEINFFAKNNKIDMIVMGMEGAGYLTEKLIGSITTSLIQKSKCPVLAIDIHVKFKSIKKIALAYDYNEIPNQSILEPVKEFAHLFKSHVYILNVVRELDKAPMMNKTIEGIELDNALEDVGHSFHYTKSNDIVEGINDFVHKQKIDMVVMIPRMHLSIKDIFRESRTKRMAFHTATPLLALHE